MTHIPELIVMLTYNDLTVKDAYAVFESCKDTEAKCWGFKEEPLPLPDMKRLFSYMKECGKITGLEVVAYSEEEGLRGAEMAYQCGCDFLMGTMFFESINSFCKKHGIKYMPFVGKVTERPSILEGTSGEMIQEANRYIEKGAFGADLLGYRYRGDAAALNREVVASVRGPVCIAGSVNSFARLDELKEAGPSYFTIGGAFFDHCFGGSIPEQINAVCRYMKK